MKNLSMLIAIAMSFHSYAQAPDSMWTKTIGGVGFDASESIQQTFDGGYVIFGNTDSFGAGYNDFWLIKTDAFGDTLWTKTFGGAGFELGHSVEQTIDSGYIVTGSTTSFGAGSNDVWLIKTDDSGNTLWTKTFGGVYNDLGWSVQQTTDEGYILTGWTESFSAHHFYDVWLIKTDASGDMLWTKTFGGAAHDVGNQIQQTVDAGYIIVGRTQSFGNGEDDIWLIKTDASGDTLWTKTFGGAYNDLGLSVEQTSDSGYIVTGSTTSFGDGSKDVWLIKTDKAGDTLWTKIFGGSGLQTANSVRQTTDGGYILTGVKSSYGVSYWDVWLIKTDNSGDTLWTKVFGGSEYESGNSVQQTRDGGYILTGFTSSFGAGYDDVWLIKTAPDPTKIEENIDLFPLDFSLHQNYPNPFNPSTTIRFTLSQQGLVKLNVYNILGERVAQLINTELTAGVHEVAFNGRNLASGVYFYALDVQDKFIEVKKMILMK